MKNGNDKSGQRAEERRQAAIERLDEIKALDPPFPFIVIAFEHDFFGMSANPPEKLFKDED